jgi:hypothetical protein
MVRGEVRWPGYVALCADYIGEGEVLSMPGRAAYRLARRRLDDAAQYGKAGRHRARAPQCKWVTEEAADGKLLEALAS